MIIEHEGKLWQCLEAIHKTPGNKRAFVQAKLRNIPDGNQMVTKFSSTESLERAHLREKTMQFLYADDEFFNFMNTENYEQIQVGKALLGDSANYLLPETQVNVTFYEEMPVGVHLPTTMEFEVTEAEPNLKTATATAAYKNAKIETGGTVKVPPFIEAGERIIVNTETGEYVSRAKK